MGEQAFFPAGQEHGIELKPLGAVKGHQADLINAFGLFVFHHQRHVFQKRAQRVERFKANHQFFQVINAPRGFDGFIELPVINYASLVEDQIA